MTITAAVNRVGEPTYGWIEAKGNRGVEMLSNIIKWRGERYRLAGRVSNDRNEPALAPRSDWGWSRPPFFNLCVHEVMPSKSFRSTWVAHNTGVSQYASYNWQYICPICLASACLSLVSIQAEPIVELSIYIIIGPVERAAKRWLRCVHTHH